MTGTGANERVVIIGAGQGGFQAAASLRQEGHTGPITLINGETDLPYQRPPLSKAFLKSGEASALLLRPKSFYADKKIELLSDTWVTSIDRAAKTIKTQALSIPYDRLILATGTRNLRPSLPGIETALDLRSQADALRLRDALTIKRRIAVIGGGFIGLEFAAVARAMGHEVTLAEAAPRLMARAVSPFMSDRFASLHRGLGTTLHLGQPVTTVSADGVTLADGTAIAADLVLLAAGVRPNTELAAAAGLPAPNGVLVDTRLRTTDPNIHALGDCAYFPNQAPGPQFGTPIRLESVQAATDHARTIAKYIVQGDAAAYSAVPWFWSDQSDCKLQIAGLASADDDSQQVSEDIVLRFAGQHLSAVETINNAKVHMKSRRLLAAADRPTRDKLETIGYDLMSL